MLSSTGDDMDVLLFLHAQGNKAISIIKNGIVDFIVYLLCFHPFSSSYSNPRNLSHGVCPPVMDVMDVIVCVTFHKMNMRRQI